MADAVTSLDAIDRSVLAQLSSDLDAEMARALVGAFVEELEERLATIEAALAAGDLATLAFQSHALKSTAGTYGADQLHRASGTVDRICQAGDPAGALAQGRALPALIRRAIAGFRHWLAETA